MIAEMDKVSGLSGADIQRMDEITGLGGEQPSQSRPEDKVTGIPRTLLNISQGAGDIARNIGLGGVTDVLATSAPMQAVEKATGINPMMKSEDIDKKTIDIPVVGRVTKPLTAVKDVAGATSWMLPGVNVLKGGTLLKAAGNAAIEGGLRGGTGGFSASPEGQELPFAAGGVALGTVLGPILGLLKNGTLTQKGVNNAMEKAKNVSVKRGDFQVETDFYKAVEDKLSQMDPHNLSADLRKAVQARLNKLPSLTEGGTKATGEFSGMQPKKLSADWFHSLRRALDKEINWAKQTNSPVDEQAVKLIRQVASDQLHTMAPETELLDALNRLYYKPFIKGGRIPGTNMKLQYNDKLTGVPSAALNALIGAEAVKKIMTGKF